MNNYMDNLSMNEEGYHQPGMVGYPALKQIAPQIIQGPITHIKEEFDICDFKLNRSQVSRKCMEPSEVVGDHGRYPQFYPDDSLGSDLEEHLMGRAIAAFRS